MLYDLIWRDVMCHVLPLLQQIVVVGELVEGLLEDLHLERLVCHEDRLSLSKTAVWCIRQERSPLRSATESNRGGHKVSGGGGRSMEKRRLQTGPQGQGPLCILDMKALLDF